MNTDRAYDVDGDRGISLNPPWWFRLAAIVLAIFLLAPGLVLLVKSWGAASSGGEPFGSGVAQLMIAGTIVALIALAPWKGLGLRVRKVGFIEFERVINTQAREHVEAFAELRTRIDELEMKVRGLDSVASITEYFIEPELYPLLTKFLKQFQPRAFSPLKIREWGARQAGYEKLASFSQGAIRTVLQKMVSDGHATTRVSRLGNTLYKVAD